MEPEGKPTRASIDRWMARLVNGVWLRCDRNDRLPVRAGFVGVVAPPLYRGDRSRSRRSVQQRDPVTRRLTGEQFVLRVPPRVGDVVSVTEDEITYRSGGRVDALVTWVILPGEPD